MVQLFIRSQLIKSVEFYLSLSPPQQSRVGMMVYFPFYTLINVNIWKFFTHTFELERDLSSAYAKRLALLPSKSWFRTEGYGLLAPATGQQISDWFVVGFVP